MKMTIYETCERMINTYINSKSFNELEINDKLYD